MNLSAHSFGRGRRLAGLRWFLVPVAFNVLLQTIPTFDGGATNAAATFFSIPYWAIVAVIGVRRARRITLYDLVFLVVGQVGIVALLWHVHPQTRSLSFF